MAIAAEFLSQDDIRRLHEDHVLIQFVSQKGAIDNLIPFKEGKGVYFTDTEDNKWIDFCSQLFNLQLGHQHPNVVEAVKRQADRYCYVRPTSNLYDVRADFSQRLAKVTPGDLNKFYYTVAGSDAVEFAMKIAYMYTNRPKVCSFYRSYHGSNFGVKSVGGDAKNWAGGPNIPNVYKVHNPYPYRCPFGYAPEGNVDVYVQHVIDTIEYEGPHLTAAVLMESIPGSNGMIILPPPGFLPRIKEYCESKGILFIADEVMTGFGRTGKMFAIEHFGVVPDLMCCAKGISNGAVPMGCVAVNKKVSDFLDDNVLYVGATYSAHPLACAAASAVLQTFEEENVLQNCDERGKEMMDRLQKFKDKYQVVGDVRSLGLLGVIELVSNRETREALTDETIMGKLRKYYADNHLLLFIRWQYILLVPPLVITSTELQDGLDRMEKGLAFVTSLLGDSQ